MWPGARAGTEMQVLYMGHGQLLLDERERDLKGKRRRGDGKVLVHSSNSQEPGFPSRSAMWRTRSQALRPAFTGVPGTL